MKNVLKEFLLISPKDAELDKLSVRANFLRRGGIEINPVRTTPGYPIHISREIRQ